MLHNNTKYHPTYLFFCSNDRPNGRVTEYLLYHNNQMVYRGSGRQHSIAGKREKAKRWHTRAREAAVCTVAVEGCFREEWSERKAKRSEGVGGGGGD